METGARNDDTMAELPPRLAACKTAECETKKLTAWHNPHKPRDLAALRVGEMKHWRELRHHSLAKGSTTLAHTPSDTQESGGALGQHIGTNTFVQ